MSNIKTTDVIVAVRQALREHKDANLSSNAAVETIVQRVLELTTAKPEILKD